VCRRSDQDTTGFSSVKYDIGTCQVEACWNCVLDDEIDLCESRNVVLQRSLSPVTHQARKTIIDVDDRPSAMDIAHINSARRAKQYFTTTDTGDKSVAELEQTHSDPSPIGTLSRSQSPSESASPGLHDADDISDRPESELGIIRCLAVAMRRSDPTIGFT